jgi:hypothetical protein
MHVRKSWITMPLSVSRGRRLDHNARFDAPTKVDTAHLSIQPAPHLQTISGMVGGGSGPFSIFLLDRRAIASNNQCAPPIHPAPPHPRLSRETRACLSQSGLFGPFFSSGWQWEPRSPGSASPEPPVPGGFSVNKFSAKTALNSTFEKFAEPNSGQFVMQKYSGCDPWNKGGKVTGCELSPAFAYMHSATSGKH